jgi:hypothetical protein
MYFITQNAVRAQITVTCYRDAQITQKKNQEVPARRHEVRWGLRSSAILRSVDR